MPIDKPVIQFDPYSNPNAGLLPHEQKKSEVDMLRVSPQLTGQCLEIAAKVLRILRERNPAATVNLENIAMDIAVVHTHGRPLKIGAMMFTTDRELLEDVATIGGLIDRYTGKLPDWVKLHHEEPRA